METKSIDFINQGFRKEILGFHGNVHWFHVNSGTGMKKIELIGILYQTTSFIISPKLFLLNRRYI